MGRYSNRGYDQRDVPSVTSDAHHRYAGSDHQFEANRYAGHHAISEFPATTSPRLPCLHSLLAHDLFAGHHASILLFPILR